MKWSQCNSGEAYERVRHALRLIAEVERGRFTDRQAKRLIDELEKTHVVDYGMTLTRGAKVRLRNEFLETSRQLRTIKLELRLSIRHFKGHN